MNAIKERPEWWFSEDEDMTQDMVESLELDEQFQEECFEAAACRAVTWAWFMSDGTWYGGLEGRAIKASKYAEEDYSTLSQDELVVLLMDGSNAQTLRAKHELRERLRKDAAFIQHITDTAVAAVANRSGK